MSDFVRDEAEVLDEGTRQDAPGTAETPAEPTDSGAGAEDAQAAAHEAEERVTEERRSEERETVERTDTDAAVEPLAPDAAEPSADLEADSER